jgi:hypothetical protein
MHKIFHAVALPSPTGLMATTVTNSQITLTWDQPGRADIVDSYEINVEYSINQCGGATLRMPTITILGSMWSYTILTSVEEDSSYNISLIAVNSVTRTTPAKINITTPPAGILATMP